MLGWKPPFFTFFERFFYSKTFKSLKSKRIKWFRKNVWMGHLTKQMRLFTLTHVVSWFLLQNKHNFQIEDVFKKANKLPVLLIYKYMVKLNQAIIIADEAIANEDLDNLILNAIKSIRNIKKTPRLVRHLWLSN